MVFAYLMLRDSIISFFWPDVIIIVTWELGQDGRYRVHLVKAFAFR